MGRVDSRIIIVITDLITAINIVLIITIIIITTIIALTKDKLKLITSFAEHL